MPAGFALLTWLYLTVLWEAPYVSDTGYFPITQEGPFKSAEYRY